MLNGTGRNLLRTMRQRKMESLMKRKHIVEFSADGKTAELEMCVFCKNMHNLLAVGECSYYADGYDDNHCDGFVIVDDVSLRLYEALELRSVPEQHGEEGGEFDIKNAREGTGRYVEALTGETTQD